MIPQDRQDVKYFSNFSYKKPQKSPLLLGTMRALKSLSSPLLSKCNCATLLHRSVFGLKGRAFPKFKYILSHNTTTLSSIISRKGRKKAPGNSGEARAGLSSVFCPGLPKFSEIIPGLPNLTLDTPAETVL